MEIQQEENTVSPGMGDWMVNVIDGFFNYLYPITNTFEGWIRRWVFGTRFKMFITTLPVHKTPGTPARRNNPGIPGTVTDYRKIFLKWMAEVILSAGDDTLGFRKLEDLLKRRDVPVGIRIPDGLSDLLNGVGEKTEKIWNEGFIPPIPNKVWMVAIGLLCVGVSIAAQSWVVFFGFAIIATLVMLAKQYFNILKRRP